MYATNILDATIPAPPDTLTNADTGTNADGSTDARHEIAEIEIDLEFDGIVGPVTVRRPQARCADGHGTLTHLFFSDVPLDIARAKAICGKCGLRASCLQGALERAEPWGVWGGELIETGRIVVNKRPRGRPPKHPRPVVEVDEVPIPPHLVA